LVRLYCSPHIYTPLYISGSHYNGIGVPNSYTLCFKCACGKEFDSVIENDEHKQKCKKYKEREVVCLSCKKKLHFDDKEMQEYTEIRRKLNGHILLDYLLDSRENKYIKVKFDSYKKEGKVCIIGKDGIVHEE